MKKKDWVAQRDAKRRERPGGDLRSTDVAHVLDCSPDDVIAWARAGRLKGYQKGRFWRFKKRDVLKFKKERGRE